MSNLQGRRLIVEIHAKFDYLSEPESLAEDVAREQTDLVLQKMAFDLQNAVKLLIDRNFAILQEYFRERGANGQK